jgi:hypothetical protein
VHVTALIANFLVVTFIPLLEFSQRRQNIEVTPSRFHFEFLTALLTFEIYLTVDSTFARQNSVRLTHAQTFFRSAGDI